MKTSLTPAGIFLLSLALFNCGDASSGNTGSAQMGKITLTIDNKVISLNHDDDILTMSFVNGDHVLLGVISQANDLQFSISAYATALEKKTLNVYECNGPSTCEESEDAENQHVLLAPYIKDPLPPVSESRAAYRAPDLGVSPLVMTITEVLDEKLEGTYFPTKRVKGKFSGTLVYIEQADGHWVVKSSTNVDGTFDIFCTIQ